jgi:NADH dehydrogenase FAD-containing subunit
MCLLHLTNVSCFKEQGNRRVLATDEWLRVEGCDNVYALGDCATINQRKVMVPVPFTFLLNIYTSHQ